MQGGNHGTWNEMCIGVTRPSTPLATGGQQLTFKGRKGRRGPEQTYVGIIAHAQCVVLSLINSTHNSLHQKAGVCTCNNILMGVWRGFNYSMMSLLDDAVLPPLP